MEPEENLLTLTGPDTVSLNGVFSVTYGIRGAEDLRAQDVTVSYDKDRFEFMGVNPIDSGKSYTVTVMKPENDENAGKMSLMFVVLGESISGDADVLELKFKAKDFGEGDISVNAILSDSKGHESEAVGASKSVRVVKGKGELWAAILNARAVLDSSKEGIEIGQYPAGTKARLLAAHNAAHAVWADESASWGEIEDAVDALDAAVARFQSFVITESMGDVNGDQRISIGDLAIIGANYGKTSADADWDAM